MNHFESLSTWLKILHSLLILMVFDIQHTNVIQQLRSDSLSPTLQLHNLVYRKQ